MDPVATTGMKIASSVITPLIKRLFISDGPGADVGLAGKPVRLSGLVSFTGERRTLSDKQLDRLADALVASALRSGERPIAPDEREAVTAALAATLRALGEITLTDVEAVELGHEELASRMRAAAGRPERHLSADATYFHDRLVDLACLHILRFFTQRSTFVATTLVAQSRRLAELAAKVDALAPRVPGPHEQDAAFERDYLDHVRRKHGRLTIYGIDLANSPSGWQLDAAYLSLEATTGTAARTRPRDGDDAEVVLPATTVRPADEALADATRVLLRGVAGSGKTTLAQWLAVSAAQPETEGRMAYLSGRVPFVLPMRTLLSRQLDQLPDPGTFLSVTGNPCAGTQPRGWEHRVLKDGRALVLVDGIDEVPEPERRRARHWLTKLIDAYPDGNRWLVTSRPSAVPEGWLANYGFTDLTLADMSASDVAAFIDRWHTAARTGDPDYDQVLEAYARDLRNAVRAKPDLGRLATNPLLCGLICALNRDRRGYLPGGRMELYSAALSMLLIRRDQERGMVGPELREQPQIQILQRLAYWLIHNGRTEMSRSRAEEIVAAALPSVPAIAAMGDAPAILDHFLLRSGLLQEPVPDAVEFIHRTFQDYLGARHAVDEGNLGALAQNAANDQWEDVIRMAVGHARRHERAEILRELLKAADRVQQSSECTRLRLLAATCLSYATDLDPEVRADVEQHTAGLIPPRNTDEADRLATVGPLVLDLLPGPDGLEEGTAAAVVTAACLIASEQAIPFLTQYVNHPSVHVRDTLARYWRRHDTESYGRDIVARLTPDGTMFTAHSEEHLEALSAMGTRPALHAVGDISQELIAAYASEASLTRIQVTSNGQLCDLDFLRGQARLTIVSIASCPNLTDLSGLADVPLNTLHLTEDSTRTGLSVLRGIPTLRKLSLCLGPRERVALSSIPPLDALRYLDMSAVKSLPSGLQRLGRLTGLESLLLGPGTSPCAASDWEEFTCLPRLNELSLASGALALLPTELVLSKVQYLSLICGYGQTGLCLERLPSAFPGLQWLVLEGAIDEVDLAPLADLQHVTRVQLPSIRPALRGTDRLPERVQLT
ncbi:NACHT domain-containing protein [Streptomyces boninensis]|uniref:NACHT domain-containing protein n=1 Tax=Streptomyces boninensis TaxID=2039455 RepID=UPI003B221383